MKKQFLSVASACGLVLALGACGEGAEPAEEAAAEVASIAADPIATRQGLLEGMGDAFMAIRGQMEGDMDFAVLTDAANTINSNAGEFINHFPEGTSMESGADTEALAVIWEDPEGFSAAHAQLLEATAGLVAAAESGDAATFGEVVGPLGMACKNCHDTYRKPQE
jgi:cytochrome c556